MTKRIALICGVGGQDGGGLARLLLSKNYIVLALPATPQLPCLI